VNYRIMLRKAGVPKGRAVTVRVLKIAQGGRQSLVLTGTLAGRPECLKKLGHHVPKSGKREIRSDEGSTGLGYVGGRAISTKQGKEQRSNTNKKNKLERNKAAEGTRGLEAMGPSAERAGNREREDRHVNPARDHQGKTELFQKKLMRTIFFLPKRKDIKGICLPAQRGARYSEGSYGGFGAICGGSGLE